MEEKWGGTQHYLDTLNEGKEGKNFGTSIMLLFYMNFLTEK